jgi:hypothetical protein
MFANRVIVPFVLIGASFVVMGCNNTMNTPQTSAPKVQSNPDVVAVERAKLSPADRALVDAQEWCVVSTDERLGSMGPPLKLEIKGQPVFVCCKGCKKKAEADPDKTLMKVAELKAKVDRESKR